MEEGKKIIVGIGVIIKKENKVLLGKYKDGEWRMPGGKMEYNEEFEETAKREVMEETGIKVNYMKIVCVNNDKLADNHYVTIGAMSEYWEGEPSVKEPDKFSEWGWFDVDDLPFPIYLPSAKILMNVKKGKFYFSN